jgi:hypothetical protein
MEHKGNNELYIFEKPFVYYVPTGLDPPGSYILFYKYLVPPGLSRKGHNICRKQITDLEKVP